MRIKTLIIIVWVFCLFSCLSCKSQSSNNAEFPDTLRGLKISIQNDKDSYLIGETINVIVTLANISDRELRIHHTAPWLSEYPPMGTGLKSKTYKEGHWWEPGPGMLPIAGIIESIIIPIGKCITHTDTHTAKEPGNPILVAYLSSLTTPGISGATEADFNNGQYGNWYGVVMATKIIEVKKEIHPDILRVLNELEATILSTETSPLSYEKRGLAVEKLHEIGCAAKGTLLRLLRNSAIVTVYEGRPPIGEITALSSLTSEFFDEEVYRELMKIACDTTNSLQVRFEVMWPKGIQNVEVIIPQEFKKWMYQQLARLRSDKESEIRDAATRILGHNKDELISLGLDDLLK